MQNPDYTAQKDSQGNVYPRNPVNLQIGKNKIYKTDGNNDIYLEVLLEKIAFGNFKITPLNFPEMSLSYYLTFVFSSSTGISKVSMTFSTETGFPQLNPASFQGLKAYYANIGAQTSAYISVKKYRYLKSRGCQDKSENEIQ